MCLENIYLQLKTGVTRFLVAQVQHVLSQHRTLIQQSLLASLSVLGTDIQDKSSQLNGINCTKIHT